LAEPIVLIEEVVSRNLAPSATPKQEASLTAPAGTDADRNNTRFSENPEPPVIKEQSNASIQTAAIPMTIPEAIRTLHFTEAIFWERKDKVPKRCPTREW
jgi:hypothetical protein